MQQPRGLLKLDTSFIEDHPKHQRSQIQQAQADCCQVLLENQHYDRKWIFSQSTNGRYITFSIRVAWSEDMAKKRHIWPYFHGREVQQRVDLPFWGILFASK